MQARAGCALANQRRCKLTSSQRSIGFATVGLSLVTALWACGPEFPNWLLDGGESGMLRSPRARFGAELDRLQGLRPSSFKAVVSTNEYPAETLAAEINDLRQALRQKNIPDPASAQLVAAYEEERSRLNQLRAQVEEWRSWSIAGRNEPPPLWEQPRVPAGVPPEFAIYFQGAIEFAAGRTNGARVAWERLLDLPVEERHHRSVWAAYMLGKLDVDADPSAASLRFQQARDLVKHGFADSLGLAASSLGWEARAALKQKDYTRAIDLYLEQESGGWRDRESLQIVAHAAISGDRAALQSLAAYQPSRRVITAYLISTSVSYSEEKHASRSKQWLQAVQDAGVIEPEAADQFALMAYQSGEFELAERWLAITPPDSIAALWLKAKLRLRDGDLDAAAALLAEATRRLPKPEPDHASGSPKTLVESLVLSGDTGDKRLRGELGVLYLQRREFVEALDVILRAGYSADAAFLADRIVTLEELKTYIDQNWPSFVAKRAPAKDSDDKTDNESETDKKHRSDIRYLLARRLTRADRFEEARPYFPAEWLSPFNRLVLDLSQANDPNLPRGVRADAFWMAARITRQQGLELFGTALEPDWQIHAGQYAEGGPSLAPRSAIPESSVLHPTVEEMNRARASAPDPDHRFHYRYLAANLAWKAAELMPDQSDETARVLCEAGGWIKARDPKYADFFYKALVIRCGRTELGTAADRKRWFPQMDEHGRLAEPMPPPVQSTFSGPWKDDEFR